MKNLITNIEKGSIAEEVGISSGDYLISINGKEIKDVFDYRYAILDEYIEVLIYNADGSQVLYEIEKDENEDLGISFETGLIDKASSCKNNCIFCFIDQLPKNMRSSLYFKDDDSRLSFLQGNYVTLTNMSDEDIDRIIFYHLSPINISVHSTDSKLREFMLKNRNSGNIIKYIEKLYNANIEMNFQIVLCKNINDKQNLDKTIEDLSRYIPKGHSLSVVPVGLTKYRENLFELEPFTKEDCLNIILQLECWQEKLKKKYETSFCFASDEFYLMAEKDIPKYDFYEDFPQIENGVGMISLFEYEFNKALESQPHTDIKKTVSVVTGEASYEFIKKLILKLNNKFPDVEVLVYCVHNSFFGDKITVSGLLTGRDIINSLKDKYLGNELLIPNNALRKDDTVFLDDVDIKEIEKSLNIKVKIVKVDGFEFLKEILF